MVTNAEFELLNPDAQIDLLSKYLYLEINQVPVRQGTPITKGDIWRDHSLYLE